MDDHKQAMAPPPGPGAGGPAGNMTPPPAPGPSAGGPPGDITPPPGPGAGGPPGRKPVVLPALDWAHMTLDWKQYHWKLSGDGSYYELRFVYYAVNILSREHQYMNIYVPAAYLRADGTVNCDGTCGAYTARTAPVIMYNNCGGWMSSIPGEVRMDYIAEGFVHVDVGARSRNAGPAGKAPAPAVDQKAAVRMLRLHDLEIPGDKNRIISCGGSGGGQMSSIIGASGNMKAYLPYLHEIGAAGVEKTASGEYISTIPDNIYGSQCYCPIADIDHADLAYAWQRFDDPEISFSGFGVEGTKTLTPFQLELQKDLAQAWARYINAQQLRNEAGEPLTFPENSDGTLNLRAGSYYRQILGNMSDAFMKYITAHRDADGTFHVTITHGFESKEQLTFPSVDAYLDSLADSASWITKKVDGTYRITDMKGFCRGTKLARGKDCPGFDTWFCSAENNAFGRPDEQAVHFAVTDGKVMAANREKYASLEGFAACDVDAYIQDAARADIPAQTYLLNATQIMLKTAKGEEQSEPSAFWRTRNGTADEHTSFCIAYNLCMAAKACGRDVDYSLIWNAGHGDVDGDGTGSFTEWVHRICKN